MSNYWHYKMMDRDEDQFAADKLLALMRIEVEELLQAEGFTSPLSQSLRAKQGIEAIEKKIEEIRADIKTYPMASDAMSACMKERRKLDLLEDFLAVHRAVHILDGRAIRYKHAETEARDKAAEDTWMAPWDADAAFAPFKDDEPFESKRPSDKVWPQWMTFAQPHRIMLNGKPLTKEDADKPLQAGDEIRMVWKL